MIASHPALASPLRRCRAHRFGGEPCWTSICPVCERLIGRWLEWTLPVALRSAARQGESREIKPNNTVVVTLKSPARFIVATETGWRAPIEQAKPRFDQALHDAGVTIAAGMIGLECIADAVSEFEFSCRPVLRAVILGSQVSLPHLKHALAVNFGRSPDRRDRTVAMRVVTDFSELAGLPRTDLRRTQIEPGPRKANGRRGRRRYRAAGLSPSEVAQLLECLAGLRTPDRLFLLNARVATNKGGYPIIRATPQAIELLKDAYNSDNNNWVFAI